MKNVRWSDLVAVIVSIPIVLLFFYLLAHVSGGPVGSSRDRAADVAYPAPISDRSQGPEIVP